MRPMLALCANQITSQSVQQKTGLSHHPNRSWTHLTRVSINCTRMKNRSQLLCSVCEGHLQGTLIPTRTSTWRTDFTIPVFVHVVRLVCFLCTLICDYTYSESESTFRMLFAFLDCSKRRRHDHSATLRNDREFGSSACGCCRNQGL